MTLKPGVAGTMQPQLAAAVSDANAVYAAAGYDLVVTSLADGVHMAGSLHPRGYAADLRSSNLGADLPAVFASLKARLGPDYDVILEADHIHVEYDPQHNGGATLPDFPVSDMAAAGSDGLDVAAAIDSAAGGDTSGQVVESGLSGGLLWGLGAAGVFFLGWLLSRR